MKLSGIGLGLTRSRGRQRPAPGPVNSVLPEITGTPEIGQELAGSNGSWTGTGDISYEYEWLRDGVSTGAPSGVSTYTPVEIDDLKTLSFRVYATDDEGTRSAVSAGVLITYTAPVAAGLLGSRSFQVNTGEQGFSAASDFTGGGLSFSISGNPAGVTIDAVSCFVTVDTDATGLFDDDESTITATNSRSSVTSVVTISVVVSLDTTPPVITDYDITEGAGVATVSEPATGYILVNGVSDAYTDGQDIIDLVISETGDLYQIETLIEGENEFDITGSDTLDPGTYYVHFTAKDDAGNVAAGQVETYVVAASETTATIAASGNTSSSGGLTSHPITIPSGSNDELIVVLFTVASGTTSGAISINTGTSGAGWVLEHAFNGSGGDGAQIAIIYKVADGDDALNMTSGTSLRSMHSVYRYTPGTGLFDIAFANGSGVPTALALDMTTSAEYLWGSAIVNYNDADQAHTVPTSFGTINTYVHAANPTIMDRRLSSAHRTHTTDELTGVTWTYGGTTRWAAALWAVGPA